MSEFFKNNPVALRHCLLYEFLQKKSDRKAFIDFRVTVGKNVIRKKRLQFWFNQFRQGKFDNNQKPVADLKEILRSDKTALRACVLYESLAKPKVDWGKIGDTDEVPFSTISPWKPVTVFDKYKNLCRVIGEVVMEYQEFEFWFYRFVNGEYDLDFERDKYKKVYELMDMPIDVMKNIVKYSDIFDRLALMQTSQSLRTFVKDQKLSHQFLFLYLGDDQAVMEYGNGKRAIFYTKKENDWYRQLGRREEKMIQGVFHWKKALEEFKGVLHHPKIQLDSLQIELVDVGSKEHERKAIDELSSAFELAHQVPVKSFSIVVPYLNPVLTILPCLKPGYLTNIDIRGYETDDHGVTKKQLKKLVKMKQWKQAKCFEMYSPSFVAPRRHLFHFKKFDVCLRWLSVKHIREMKEILFKSPDFERCSLHIVTPNSVTIMPSSFKNDMKQEFGDTVRRSPDIYHYPIPNSTEYFEIDLGGWSVRITRKKN